MNRFCLVLLFIVLFSCVQAPSFGQGEPVSFWLLGARSETEKTKQKEEWEREDLSALWAAVCVKSSDIQFVKNKLDETPANRRTTLARMLSRALEGSMGQPRMIVPTVRIECNGNTGFPNLLGYRPPKSADEERKRTETIVLYDLVRRNCDRLVELYRKYMNQVELLSSSDGKDEKRNSEDREQVQKTRGELVEMAGTKAVDDLEAQRAARAERDVVIKLWNSFVDRSQDIQFVLSKVQHDSVDLDTFDLMQAKSWHAAMGVDSLVFGPKIPVVPISSVESASSRIVVIKGAKGKDGRRLSQTEQIMLHDLVIRNRDKLYQVYREYSEQKVRLSALDGSADARARVRLAGDLQKTRAQLVEMCGAEAVDELDRSFVVRH